MLMFVHCYLQRYGALETFVTTVYALYKFIVELN